MCPESQVQVESSLGKPSRKAIFIEDIKLMLCMKFFFPKCFVTYLDVLWMWDIHLKNQLIFLTQGLKCNLSNDSKFVLVN